MDFDWYMWVVLPLLVFGARIADVSLGTMRILFVVRGNKLLAAALGFSEVFIWVVVVRQIMTADVGLLHFAAYAAGFATGNVVGIGIEERLAVGLRTVRVITPFPTVLLEREMLARGYGATRVAAEGLRGGRMTILFSTMPRRKVDDFVRLIERHLPRAFISVEDVESVREGYLPLPRRRRPRPRRQLFGRIGK